MTATNFIRISEKTYMAEDMYNVMVAKAEGRAQFDEENIGAYRSCGLCNEDGVLTELAWQVMERRGDINESDKSFHVRRLSNSDRVNYDLVRGIGFDFTSATTGAEGITWLVTRPDGKLLTNGLSLTYGSLAAAVREVWSIVEPVLMFTGWQG